MSASPNETRLREALLTVDSMLIAGASPGTVRTIIKDALVETGHSCEWCPLDIRDLFALAANAVTSYGTSRERSHLLLLKHGIEHYQPAIDSHFGAVGALGVIGRRARAVLAGEDNAAPEQPKKSSGDGGAVSSESEQA